MPLTSSLGRSHICQLQLQLESKEVSIKSIQLNPKQSRHNNMLEAAVEPDLRMVPFESKSENQLLFKTLFAGVRAPGRSSVLSTVLLAKLSICFSCNGKSDITGGLNGKVIYKWEMFHCHVWLPEGNPMMWCRVSWNVSNGQDFYPMQFARIKQNLLWEQTAGRVWVCHWWFVKDLPLLFVQELEHERQIREAMEREDCFIWGYAGLHCQSKIGNQQEFLFGRS